MKSKWLAQGATGQWGGVANSRIDWANDTIKVALMTDAFVPSESQSNWGEIDANETSGDNYTAGGTTIDNKNVQWNTTRQTVVLDGDDCIWPTLTATFRWGVIYKVGGTDADSPLIGLVDFESNQIVSDLTFAIVWDVDGILNASVVP